MDSKPELSPARRRALRIAVEIALVIAVLAGIRAWQQAGIASGAAPPLSGTLLDGAPYTLAADPRRPLLVHFWATWCAICRLEQGSIGELARDHAVITVAMQSGAAAEVAAHLREQGLAFAVINDPDGTLAAHWGVRAVPASFIIDAGDRIRFVEVGYTTRLGLAARLWWAQ